MTDTKNLLRLNGYAADNNSRIFCNAAREEERIAVLQFDLSGEDSKAGRDVVEQLLAVADSPRALCGRTKSGNTVLLLFRRGQLSPVPTINGQTGDVFKFASRDGSVRLAITCAPSMNQTVNMAEYTFQKNRSPFDVKIWELPTLTNDISKEVIDAVFGFGLTWAQLVDDDRAREQRYADIKSGKIKIPTESELQDAADDKLVAYYAGVEFGQFDDMRATVRAARLRVAARKATTAA